MAFSKQTLFILFYILLYQIRVYLNKSKLNTSNTTVSQNTMSLSDLPQEFILDIVNKLEIKSVFKFSMTSKQNCFLTLEENTLIKSLKELKSITSMSAYFGSDFQSLHLKNVNKLLAIFDKIKTVTTTHVSIPGYLDNFITLILNKLNNSRSIKTICMETPLFKVDSDYLTKGDYSNYLIKFYLILPMMKGQRLLVTL